MVAEDSSPLVVQIQILSWLLVVAVLLVPFLRPGLRPQPKVWGLGLPGPPKRPKWVDGP